jgi:hypothetical protein
MANKHILKVRPPQHSTHLKCFIYSLFSFQNMIKGYISYQHQKLVVSKQNPFPSLGTVS